MTESEPARSASSNHRVWLAPLLALFGLLSYFLLFARWPLLRDFPWLNLSILAVAVLLSLSALPRARSTSGRLAGVAGLLVSLGMTGLLCFYVFHLSYQLPAPELAADDGTRIPGITLASWDGETIDVADAARGELILVFYRGYW